MNLEIFARQLQLLELLTGNTEQSVQDICRQVGISLRTFHRYIALFRAAGFELTATRGIYTILHTSPLFANVTDRVRLRNSEATRLLQLLSTAEADPTIVSLRRKFSSIYGIDISDMSGYDEPPTADAQKIGRNTAQLEQAIRQRRKVVLHDYASPRRSETTDRLVEPFRLLTATSSVRCYEADTDSCKTFKIARIRGEVELLAQSWEHPTRHTNYYIDLFGFAGETRHRVILRLSPLAVAVLCEEFGVRESQLLIDPEQPTHRIFATQVCSPIGIGRFVMGLLNDIDILRGNELHQFITHELQRYQAKQE